MTAAAAARIRNEPGGSVAQAAFDPLGEPHPVRELGLADGRTVRYIDAGRPGWRPVVFFGGLGTSVGAFSLTEFARSTREALRLRVVSVERNGFGGTPFDEARGYAEAACDVLAVLSALAIERFAVVAISGGAPFAAALAARVPQRVISLHLAAAAVPSLGAHSAAASALLADPETIAADPAGFWRFPPGSPVHLVPGFGDAAASEGRRALGGRGAGAALAHEWRLLCGEELADLRSLRAPAYLYAGAGDELVTSEHVEAWQRALPSVVAVRRYAGEAHDVQYRHWDQILFDAAGVSALGQLTLVCQDGAARLVGPGELDDRLAAGATLGLCAWAQGNDAGTNRDQKGTA